jgi:hypothetical protein
MYAAEKASWDTTERNEANFLNLTLFNVIYSMFRMILQHVGSYDDFVSTPGVQTKKVLEVKTIFWKFTLAL